MHAENFRVAIQEALQSDARHQGLGRGGVHAADSEVQRTDARILHNRLGEATRQELVRVQRLAPGRFSQDHRGGLAHHTERVAFLARQGVLQVEHLDAKRRGHFLPVRARNALDRDDRESLLGVTPELPAEQGQDPARLA